MARRGPLADLHVRVAARLASLLALELIVEDVIPAIDAISFVPSIGDMKRNAYNTKYNAVHTSDVAGADHKVGPTMDVFLGTNSLAWQISANLAP